MFDYRRLVSIVLRIVSIHDQEEFVQRIGIYLLNSLVCQVEGYQKQLVGELGAIEVNAITFASCMAHICIFFFFIEFHSSVHFFVDDAYVDRRKASTAVVRRSDGNCLEYNVGCHWYVMPLRNLISRTLFSAILINFR